MTFPHHFAKFLQSIFFIGSVHICTDLFFTALLKSYCIDCDVIFSEHQNCYKEVRIQIWACLAQYPGL